MIDLMDGHTDRHHIQMHIAVKLQMYPVASLVIITNPS